MSPSSQERSGSPQWRDLAQLWSSQFRHLGTLGIAAVAGLLILVETGSLETGWLFWVSAGSFVSASAAALDGESKLIDRYAQEEALQPLLKGYRLAAMGLIAVGLCMLYGAWTR